MAKFSIFLPVYNGGEYLKDCIRSILSQSLTDYELIVLNNFSNDGTTEWLGTLKDPKLKIYQSDRLLSMEENWDRILAIPKCEFMTIIGHDDLLDENYLATMNELIVQNPEPGLFQCHFRIINAQGEVMRNCKPMKKDISDNEFLEGILTDSIDTMGTGYMMRSADFESAGGIHGYPNLLFADHALWLKLVKGRKLAVAAKHAFSFRVHQSISRLTEVPRYIKAFYLFMDFLSEYRKTETAIESVIKKYINNYILFHCQSFSHRLLKTPVKYRDGLSVKGVMLKCKEYASLLNPGSLFQPEKRFSMQLSCFIDGNKFLRDIYLLFRSIYKMPIYSRIN
ncbi:MAG TPA: glycosyltransferase family 2 protein [Chitinophagaceae bacterium]|nr:glycosyltransferase family 2 protein [Chitinophagaceae bacterium]